MRTVELISVILLTMGPEKSTQLIHHQENLLLSLMVEFSGERSLMARQIMFGLFGDIQGFIVDANKVFLPELIRHAANNLYYDDSAMAAAGFGNNSVIQEYGSGQYNVLSVCTNACWALGEVAVTSVTSQNMKEALTPHAQQITQRFISLLS